MSTAGKKAAELSKQAQRFLGLGKGARRAKQTKRVLSRTNKKSPLGSKRAGVPSSVDIPRVTLAGIFQNGQFKSWSTLQKEADDHLKEKYGIPPFAEPSTSSASPTPSTSTYDAGLSKALGGGLVQEKWKEEPWSSVAREKDGKGKSPAGPMGLEIEVPELKGHWIKARRPIPDVLQTKRGVYGVLTASEKEEVLEDIEQTLPPPPIAVLSHGLDRVLFNPGVHWLQDQRSRVYNFTPWLQCLPKVNEFDFNRIPAFVPSSRDNDLHSLAKRQVRRFAGSTSSLTGILSQCYFLVSGDREVDTSTLSADFQNSKKTFTPAQRWPVNVTMNYRDGVYTIDKRASEWDLPEKNVLLWLGTVLEKFLTTSKEEFGRLLRTTPIPEATIHELREEREAYRYAQSKDFVMRSQLDCYDSRLPGTGVFDIKTRACSPTRMDVLNFEEHTGYTIKHQYGLTESFEKEYYDLIRSAFLKYGFQARIGNMDGVIVAYHNTETMFGFQYVPLEEMDALLFGSKDVGPKVFEKCVGMMEKICNEVVQCFPERSCRVTFFKKEGKKSMYIWVQPEEWNGDEEERPIELLSVKVESFLGEAEHSGANAVERCATPDVPWTVAYSIETLNVAPEEARARLARAHAMMVRQHYVPSGVEDVEAYWRDLAHGNATERHAGPAAFDPKIFSPALPYSIQKLREASRLGRKELEEMKEMYKDEPQIVLGQSE